VILVQFSPESFIATIDDVVLEESDDTFITWMNEVYAFIGIFISKIFHCTI
jgi:hypothetical protein